MRTAIALGLALLVTSPAWAGSSGGLPLFNATCPLGLEVHGDEGGPVYVNGKEAVLKKFNDNYYEAKDAATGTTVSLSKNPDGTLSASYTGRGGANGICQMRTTTGVTQTSTAAQPTAPSAPAARGPVVTPGNMPAFCRGEVSGMFGTRPAYVKTRPVARAKDGSTSIDGTVDKGSEGIKQFKCRFDSRGRFIDVMALTSDGY